MIDLRNLLLDVSLTTRINQWRPEILRFMKFLHHCYQCYKDQRETPLKNLGFEWEATTAVTDAMSHTQDAVLTFSGALKTYPSTKLPQWSFKWQTGFTHTSPRGAYVDPVIVNSLREQVSPSTLSRMNIYGGKKSVFKRYKNILEKQPLLREKVFLI